MASTRKASIAAEIRADRTKFKADLAAAKGDARKFSTEVRKEFAMASDISLAAKMKELRGETLKATDNVKALAQEYVRLKAAHSGIKPMQMQASGLKQRPEMMPQAFVDPGYIDRTRAGMDGLTRSTLTANTAMMTGGRGATNAGMGMLFLSQGIEDAQYGFRSIVNNIAPLVMSLGGGPGLAGVLTIVAVGFNLVGKAAAEAMDAMSGRAEREQMIKNNTAREENNARIRAERKEARRLQAEMEEQIRGDLEHSEELRRTAAVRDLDYKIKALDLEEQIAQAKLKGLSETEKANVINEREKKLMEKKLEMERQFFEDRLHNNRDNSPAANANREADKAGLAEVKRQQGLLPAQQALMDQGLANDQEKAGKESRSKLRRQVAGSMASVADTIADLAKAAAETVGKAAEKARTRAEAKTELGIATLRAGGKDKQADVLQKKLDFDKSTRDLVAKGFTPEEAQGMAAQSQRNAERTAGRGGRAGRISGAVSRNMKTGLNGEFHNGTADFMANGIGYNFNQKKNQSPGEQLKEVNEKLGRGGKGGTEMDALRDLKDALTQKLDQLITATTGTAGERVKPAATRN